MSLPAKLLSTNPTHRPRAAYIHVPFCHHRCGYCNFTLVAGRDDLIDVYLDALQIELRSSLKSPTHELDTLFLGGGTPTHLSSSQLQRLLSLVRHWFPLRPDAELSVEANPSDLANDQGDKLKRLVDHGVNRLSLGVQSFQAGKLRALERDHTAATVQRVVEHARPLLASLSIDLIFAAPDESRQHWLADLNEALRLPIDHLSTYGLTFERGTQFWNRLQGQELKQVSEEDERWMYETTIDALTAANFEHYEISNFAKPGHRSRHNQMYWTGQRYFASGPGAARFIGSRRETNHRSTTTYLKRLAAGQSPVAESETISPEQEARERVILGMRRLEGVDLNHIRHATGVDVQSLLGPQLERFQETGWVRREGSNVRLSRAGLLISDSLWPELL